MIEQFSIFDLYPQEMGVQEYDLDTLPQEDLIEIISNATGLNFKPKNWRIDERYAIYEAKTGAYTITVNYSHYYDNNRKFISVSVDTNLSGCACGQDSIKDAIQFIKRETQRRV